MAIVPWQSVWPRNFTQFNEKNNARAYPGQGSNLKWFHCTSGTRNTIARQQSTAFTNPYSDPAKDTTGFVVPDANKGTFPTNGKGKKVGVLSAQAFTEPFLARAAATWGISKVEKRDTAAAVWALLKAKTVDAVFTGFPEQKVWTAANPGYAYVQPSGEIVSGVAFGCRPEFGDHLKL